MMMAINIPARIIVLPYEDLPAWSNEGEYRRVPNGPIVRALCCQISVWNHQLRSLTCRTSQIRLVRCVSDLAASLDRSRLDHGLDRGLRGLAVLDPVDRSWFDRGLDRSSTGLAVLDPRSYGAS